MKKLLCIASCGLLLLLAGCKKEEPKPQPQPDPQPQEQSLAGNVERPTWTTTDDYDYTSSMTAVISINLLDKYPEAAKDFVLNDNDLMAAFAGEECLGVAEQIDGLFYLYIAGPKEQESSVSVSLRYYSAHYKNLFVAADAFTFVNDAEQGTVNAPYVPAFVVAESK